MPINIYHTRSLVNLNYEKMSIKVGPISSWTAQEAPVDDGPVFRRARYEDHVSKLKQACEWLAITQGRATAYARLVTEFFEDSARTQEHILAYNESCEIVDLFELWRAHADRFPGLRRSLRDVCRKGPTLREGENPGTSSNRPRNDAFSYLVSGTLMSAGVSVVAVEGVRRSDLSGTSDADLTFMSGATCIDVECKRPQAEGALVPRMREARAQLEQPCREGRPGVVALDCSAMVRPAGTLLEYESGRSAEERISTLLEGLVPTLDPHLTSQLLGVILVARVATMMRLGQSPILSPQGRLVHEFRPETILTWLVASNAQASEPDILRNVAQQVRQYQTCQRRTRGEHETA
jgi:hypothetical protein